MKHHPPTTTTTTTTTTTCTYMCVLLQGRLSNLVGEEEAEDMITNDEMPTKDNGKGRNTANKYKQHNII